MTSPDPSNTPIDELTEPLPADDDVYDLIRGVGPDTEPPAEALPADDDVYDIVRETDPEAHPDTP